MYREAPAPTVAPAYDPAKVLARLGFPPLSAGALGSGLFVRILFKPAFDLEVAVEIAQTPDGVRLTLASDREGASVQPAPASWIETWLHGAAPKPWSRRGELLLDAPQQSALGVYAREALAEQARGIPDHATPDGMSIWCGYGYRYGVLEEVGPTGVTRDVPACTALCRYVCALVRAAFRDEATGALLDRIERYLPDET